jgi:hypothetical protein
MTNDRTVFRRSDGAWVNKRQGADRAASAHDTQAAAIAAAKAMLASGAGGELTVMGRDGRIRSKDTIAPGHDPSSIRDREH